MVADIETARRELLDQGVDGAPIDDVSRGVNQARFADPDGNTMTLQEMSRRTDD